MKKLELQQQGLQNLKIGNYQIIDFNACLKTSMIKVGVRASNIPEGVEKEVLIKFLMDNFKEFTPEMINKAFDMALSGKLDLKDSSCYGDFSCEYLGRILSAYRNFLIKTGGLKSSFDLERSYIPQKDNISEYVKMSDEENVEFMLDFWKTLKTKNIILIMVDTYDALVNLGKINLSKEEKKYFMNEAINFMNKIENKDPGFFKNVDRKSERKKIAKKLAVADYFNKILGVVR